MDGRHLRGRIFPEFTVFIPKNREYMSRNLSFDRHGKKFGVQKASGGAKKATRGRQFVIIFLDIKFCGAPFRFSGKVLFNYVTPLLELKLVIQFKQ